MCKYDGAKEEATNNWVLLKKTGKNLEETHEKEHE